MQSWSVMWPWGLLGASGLVKASLTKCLDEKCVAVQQSRSLSRTSAGRRYFRKEGNQPSCAAVSMAGHEAGSKLSGTGSLAHSWHFQTAAAQKKTGGWSTWQAYPTRSPSHVGLQNLVGSRQQDMLIWFCSAVDLASGTGACTSVSAQAGSRCSSTTV